MFARVTLLEIDTVRMSMNSALVRYKELMLPRLREQPGYRGVYVLSTPEGKGAVITLWDTPAEAATVESGFYAHELDSFTTFFRSPPGRESYEVVFAEALETASTPR
jgi:hypothetical protein